MGGTGKQLVPPNFALEHEMIRKTNFTLPDGDTYNRSRKDNPLLWDFVDERINPLWDMIENHYEEEWHIEADGSLVLEVDSDMLERVLMDNYAQAWIKYGTFAGGQTKEGKKFLLRRPEHLKGTYTIKGVYDASQRLVNGERTYYFTQEF